jgi:hypothetical protein
MSASDARMLLIDVRTGTLLARELRRRAVTRVFGIPPEQQSILTTTILIGAGATVVRGVVPWPRLSGADAAIGGAVVNEAFRAVAGPPSRAMPLAGGLIVVAIVSHSVRPVLAGLAREARVFGRELRALLRTGDPRIPPEIRWTDIP